MSFLMLEWSRHTINILLYENLEIFSPVNIGIKLGKLMSRQCQLVPIFLHIHTITYEYEISKLNISLFVCWFIVQSYMDIIVEILSITTTFE